MIVKLKMTEENKNRGFLILLEPHERNRNEKEKGTEKDRMKRERVLTWKEGSFIFTQRRKIQRFCTTDGIHNADTRGSRRGRRRRRGGGGRGGGEEKPGGSRQVPLGRRGGVFDEV